MKRILEGNGEVLVPKGAPVRCRYELTEEQDVRPVETLAATQIVHGQSRISGTVTAAERGRQSEMLALSKRLGKKRDTHTALGR